MAGENVLNGNRQPGSANSTGSRDNPAFFNGSVDSNILPLTKEINTSLAEINAGIIIIPGVAGFSIKVLNFIALSTGNFAGATSIDLEDTLGGTVAVLLVADLTDGAAVMPNSANTSVTSGFGTLFNTGEGLQVTADGTATVATNILWLITYRLEE